jgi:hypothetical protein
LTVYSKMARRAKPRALLFVATADGSVTAACDASLNATLVPSTEPGCLAEWAQNRGFAGYPGMAGASFKPKCDRISW